MNDKQISTRLNRFYIGLGVFLFSATTVAFVTDPYLMADIALVFLGIYLMVTGLSANKAHQ